jgi:predicted metal-dependent hydrolase
MYWLKKKRRKRGTSVTKHYLSYKEEARKLIVSRVNYWNQFYAFDFNRIAIRNQRRCWGSCTSLKNLNFSYKILFLPSHLQDYIIVHELCHLQELNHGKSFWALVEKQVPQYKLCIKDLKQIERGGMSASYLEHLKEKGGANVIISTIK